MGKLMDWTDIPPQKDWTHKHDKMLYALMCLVRGYSLECKHVRSKDNWIWEELPDCKLDTLMFYISMGYEIREKEKKNETATYTAARTKH
jgi:hypothetical protein